MFHWCQQKHITDMLLCQLRTVPTFVSAHIFCASGKTWFKRATDESKIFLLCPNQPVLKQGTPE